MKNRLMIAASAIVSENIVRFVSDKQASFLLNASALNSIGCYQNSLHWPTFLFSALYRV